MFGLDAMTSVLLGLCLLLAFFFVFINGFHDTANAVATVIYTNSLQPSLAVVYSGALNFIGVLSGGTAVALGIVNLLPMEALMDTNIHNNIALVISLLISAIAWNFGTWYFGIPSSSSHAIIGSVLGIGFAYYFIPSYNGPDPVNWKKASDTLLFLFISPALGFALSILIMFIFKKTIKNEIIYKEPIPGKKPPFWIRAMLLLTCGTVSFVHGQNDGQKGVGLVMLILIAILPGYYSMTPASELAPDMVVVAVAVSLGLGTMIGWKRIVKTIGEKIGKQYMSYAQGASAEIVASIGIGVASGNGISVSTTHILTSGIAGSMVVGKGFKNLQIKTVKTILLTWLLTLPATMLMSGLLFLLLRK